MRIAIGKLVVTDKLGWVSQRNICTNIFVSLTGTCFETFKSRLMLQFENHNQAFQMF